MSCLAVPNWRHTLNTIFKFLSCLGLLSQGALRSPSPPLPNIIAFQGAFDGHSYAVTIRKPVSIMSIDEVGSKSGYSNWAKMAKTPEQSDYTSAQKRIRETQQKPPQAHTHYQPRTLCSFVGYPREPMPQGLPYRLSDFLELLDWTGRIIRDDKRGAIPGNTPKVLDRLNIEAKNWLHSAQHFERSFKLFAGKMASVKAACEALGYRRIPKVGALLT